LSVSQKFEKIEGQIGRSHPQLFHLLAAIAPEDELPDSLRTAPTRIAYKKALEMVLNVQVIKT
jgi:hypothetical protein